MKDRQGLPVLCYRCGESAAPPAGIAENELAPNCPIAGPSSTPRLPPSFQHLSIGRVRRSSRLSQPIGEDSGRGGPSTITDLLADNLSSTTEPIDGESWHTSQSPTPSIVASSDGLPSKPGEMALDAPPAPTKRRSSRRPAPVPKDRAPKPITSKEESPDSQRIEVAPGHRLTAGDTTTGWRHMIACDYCLSSWHLDCLDPPAVCMPPSHKKWMCPNHVDHILVRLPGFRFGGND